MTTRLSSFLVDYEAICRKHHLIIHACGCCGSPWVAPALYASTLVAGNVQKKSEDGVTVHLEHLRSEELDEDDNEG